MSEAQTERETLLEARIKELEAAAAVRKAEASGGGTLEQIWRYFSAFIPPWIIAAGVVVFLGFHAWEYFNKAQVAAAETQLTKAQAAMRDADARARSAKVGDKDESMQLATVKVQLVQKQQEAARAKIEADAQNATIEDATTRLATLKAELAAKQAQAAKARAAADAANARFGLQTLEQRRVRATLINTELEVVSQRVGAATARAASSARSTEQMAAMVVRAECEGNKFAELIGCPRPFLQQVRP